MSSFPDYITWLRTELHLEDLPDEEFSETYLLFCDVHGYRDKYQLLRAVHNLKTAIRQPFDQVAAWLARLFPTPPDSAD